MTPIRAMHAALIFLTQLPLGARTIEHSPAVWAWATSTPSSLRSSV